MVNVKYFNCEGITKNLTVVKTNSGHNFDGVTEKGWERDTLVTDEKAFMLNLVNKEVFLLKCLSSNERNGCIFLLWELF